MCQILGLVDKEPISVCGGGGYMGERIELGRELEQQSGGCQNHPGSKMDESPKPSEAHVLVFPYPAQGHINSMLRLAELLLLSGLRITFLVTHHIQNRFLQSTTRDHSLGRLSHHPRFRFRYIPDGLPDDHPRAINTLLELHRSLSVAVWPHLLELLSSSGDDDGWPPVTCVVADGIMSFAADVCGEAGVPVVAFRTASACSFWVFFSIPNLIETGELPIPEGGDMDELLWGIPGMEGLLRRRDLPKWYQSSDFEADPIAQVVVSETRRTTNASAFILNTFEALEGPVLSHIRSHIPTTYAVGPLHAFLKEKSTSSQPVGSARMSLWEEDRGCIAWLDSQPPRSVVYISFGSFTLMTQEQLLEFSHGLVASGRRFLWVLRTGMIDVVGAPEMETEGRGLVVKWAPQEEVLEHPAVGGFLTHSGWNSTLESMVLGVPMVCWPFFSDQQVNSRYVSEAWKVGLDMKDKWDRRTVEGMVRGLMEGAEAEELRRASLEMVEMAKASVRKGGSSYMDFNRLVEDIKMKRLHPPAKRMHTCV